MEKKVKKYCLLCHKPKETYIFATDDITNWLINHLDHSSKKEP